MLWPPPREEAASLRRIGPVDNPNWHPQSSDDDPIMQARLARADELNSQAEVAMTAGQYAQAETLCLQWLDVDNTYGSAWRLLGEAREAQGNYAGELDASRAGIYGTGKFDSVSIDRATRFQFVLALLHNHQWAEAVSVYETTIQENLTSDGHRLNETVFNPNVVDENGLLFVAHYLVSYLEPRDKVRSDAWSKAHLVVALAIKPNDPQALMDWGYTLEQENNLTGARDTYLHAIQLAGDAEFTANAQEYVDRINQRIADQQSGGNGGNGGGTGGSGGSGGGGGYP